MSACIMALFNCKHNFDFYDVDVSMFDSLLEIIEDKEKKLKSEKTKNFSEIS